jgi:hypothetical protein
MKYTEQKICFCYFYSVYRIEIKHECVLYSIPNIPDNYPKYVVTRDDFPAISSYKGIIHMHLIDFISLNDL